MAEQGFLPFSFKRFEKEFPGLEREDDRRIELDSSGL
jgi:hypothetical protein